MGGSESKQETNTKIREKISSELSMKINNVNKVLNKSMTDVTTEVSNKMVDEFKSKSGASALAENTLRNVTIMAAEGAKVNITQDAAAQIEMAAMIQMVSDNQIKNDTASKVANEMLAKVKQDAAAKSALIEAAKIEEKSKEAQGFANMVGNLTNMASDMLGSLTGNSSEVKSNTDIEKEITTKINNEINNTNINENEVMNKIETTVENEFKKLTVDECFGNAESRNMMEQLTLMGGKGSQIVIAQVASTSAVAKCMTNRGIGNKALSSIANDAGFKAASEATQAAKSEGDLSKSLEQSKSTETTDAVADTVQQGIKTTGEVVSKGIDVAGNVVTKGLGVAGSFVMILPIMLGIGALAVGGFFLMKFMGGSKSNNSGDDYDYEMEGGALAIHTLQRAIILVAIVGGIDYIAKMFNKYKN